MPESVTGGRRYLPGLDGLRALAVSAVVLYHLGFGWASGGLLGVGVFFTLSGYLITDLLLAQVADGRIRLDDFWRARGRRLLPGLLSMLLVVSPWVALTGRHVPGFAGAVAASILYVGNWQLIYEHVSYFARFGPPSPIGHLWSLAIEEQFYIVWPIALGLGAHFVRERSRVPGVRPRLALLTVALAGASAVEMAVLYRPSLDTSRVYFGTDTRAFALLVGAALAMVWPSNRLRVDVAAGARRLCDAVGVLALVGVAALVWETSEYSTFLYQGGLVLLSVATAVLIAAVVHPAARIGRVLGARPLRFVGVRSYGIYLWHMPVIALTTPAGAHRVDLLRAALQVAATILLASASWRFLEEPIRRRTFGVDWRRRRAAVRRMRRSRGRPGFVALLQISALIALVSVIAVLTAAGNGRHDATPGGPKAAKRTARLSSAQISPARTTPARIFPAVASTAPKKHQVRQPPKKLVSKALRSSCRAVVDIGDSTSEGLISTDYLPNPTERMDARFDRIGVTTQHFEISGARSVVETYEGEPNAAEVVEAWKRDGYHGCWVLALGTNDAANVAVGSNTSLDARIREMMSLIGNEPVLWVDVKSLLSSGPYAEANMEQWNEALLRACHAHENMRVYAWSDAARDAWFIDDGIHYNTPGYAARARLIARALAHAFPASGRSAGCVVH
ncbi:MAG TPA: acyltransferase family protein [Gaiellaceae bacterium]|nr:acyltransferase family protein [Gaiellaceae bacterium]